MEGPAYESMKRPGPLADRMLEIVLSGVTRKYALVIPELAETVGVSKSAVSRETIEASERVLEELMERHLDGWDLLVIYVDGIQFGSHHVFGRGGRGGEKAAARRTRGSERERGGGSRVAPVPPARGRAGNPRVHSR